MGTKIYIPFTNGYMLDLNIVYWPFMLFVLLGTVNGVNLTDGLDGLAGGVTMIVAAFFLVEAWAMRNGISMISGAVIGSLFAFLIFNAYPAKVFMETLAHWLWEAMWRLLHCSLKCLCLLL